MNTREAVWARAIKSHYRRSLTECFLGGLLWLLTLAAFVVSCIGVGSKNGKTFCVGCVRPHDFSITTLVIDLVLLLVDAASFWFRRVPFARQGNNEYEMERMEGGVGEGEGSGRELGGWEWSWGWGW